MEASVAASARARTAEGTASDTAYSAPFNAAEWLPRVGISKTLGPKLSLFTQASTGYSDPTNFETLPFEDGADASATLMSERARSVEVGLRRPGLECVLYHQNVQDPIVEQVDSLGSRRLSTQMRRCRCRASRHVPNGKAHIMPCPWPPRGSITF